MNKSICVFDLDGTLDLTDSKLSAEILKLSQNGVDFVTATGRVNSYVMSMCRENNIIPPRFIIGDNGGTIFDTRKREYLKRTTLPLHTRRLILEEYLRQGGRMRDLRYTDGENVYAANNEDVKDYYSKESIIEYRSDYDLSDEILSESADITKITLAGNKKTMKHIKGFIKENGIKCWADIGKTKFPRKDRQNYRLDIMDGETCKGEAVEYLVEHADVGSFTCIGNGPNDFSMFKYALDSGMPIIIVRNFENGELSKESEKLIAKVSEYAEMIGMKEKVSITSFPINGYVGRRVEQSESRKRREGFVSGLRVTNAPTFEINTSNIQKKIPIKQDRGNNR